MKAMVKCLLCGAVFEEGVRECPVCGAGPDQFVPVRVEASAFRRDTDEKFIILGGGTAALSAAEAIRARNATCSIVLVTEENMPPYHRPMLTKALAKRASDLSIHDATWYESQNILVLTGRKVESLDAKAHLITLDGGAQLQYEKCVYALGAHCFLPPIPGMDLPEVVAIRAHKDVERVHALLGQGKRRAVVIGGGVLGLEAAWALKCLGCSVTVLERSGRLMVRQLDQESSQWLSDMAERKGVNILVNAVTARIEGDGRVERVCLSDGTSIDADLVIVSSGVRPHSAIAQSAGAEVGRAVVVNGHMETNLPDVYACGDCAEVSGVNAAIWPVATEMGRVAGANAAGEALTYAPVSLAITFQGFDTALYADGDTGRTAGKAYQVQIHRGDAPPSLCKEYFLDGALCGVILLGDISRASAYAGRV